MKINLEDGEHILAKSQKKPWVLIFGLLLNRLTPGIFLIPLIFCAILQPEKVKSVIMEEQPVVLILYAVFLSIGIIGQLFILYDYFFKQIVVTNKRLLVFKANTFNAFGFDEINNINIKVGIVTSTISISLFADKIFELEHLSAINANEIREVLQRLISRA